MGKRFKYNSESWVQPSMSGSLIQSADSKLNEAVELLSDYFGDQTSPFIAGCRRSEVN